MKAELINFELWHTYDNNYNQDKIYQYKIKLALDDIEEAIDKKQIDTVVGLMLIDGFLYSNNKKFFDALEEIEYKARALGIKNFFLLPGMCSSISYQQDIDNWGLSYRLIADYDMSAEQLNISYNGKQNNVWNPVSKKFLFLGGVPSRANRIGLLSRYYDNNMLLNAEWSFFPPWTEEDKIWCRKYLKKYSDEEYHTFINTCSKQIDDRYEQSKNYSRVNGKDFADLKLLESPWLQDPSYIDPEIYRKTSLSIVSKFEYEDADSHLFLGEKTWRAIINKHPFIIADNIASERFDYMKKIGLDIFEKFTVPNYGYIEEEEERLDAIVESTNIFINSIDKNSSIIKSAVQNNFNVLLQVLEQNKNIKNWLRQRLNVDTNSIDKWLAAKDYRSFIRIPK
jgi:hypothetical protein